MGQNTRWQEMVESAAEWPDVGTVVTARFPGAPRTHALRCTTSWSRRNWLTRGYDVNQYEQHVSMLITTAFHNTTHPVTKVVLRCRP
ncbi:hypothetical protein IG631_03371 [Alternaria alternata]|nr:hypothetical protein IG631_03371 [Alternaria alternata]